LLALLLGSNAVPEAAPPAPRDAAKLDATTRALIDGDSKSRLEALRELLFLPKGTAAQEDRLLDTALPACATDRDRRARALLASALGSRYVRDVTPQEPRAIALAIKLTGDPERNVRYNAARDVLAHVRDKGDDVIAAMIKAALGDSSYEFNLHSAIESGLAGVPPEKIAPHVEPYLAAHEKDGDRAMLAYMLFVNITGVEPPGAERLDDRGPFVVMFGVKAPTGGDPVAALALFRKHVPENLVPTVALRPRRTECEGYALAPTRKVRREIFERLGGVPEIVLDKKVMPAKPEAVEQLTRVAKLPLRKAPEPPPGPNLPVDYRKALASGSSEKRLQAFKQLAFSDVLSKDESIFGELEACAADPNAAVRSAVARALGSWVWNREPQHPRAVALAIKLSADKDASVAHDAVYYSLARVKDKSDEVIRAMIAAGLAHGPYDDINLHGIIAFGLRDVPPDRLAPLFAPHLKDADFDRATIAYAMFVQATAHEPLGVDPERFAPVRTFMLWFGQSRDSDLTTPALLLRGFRATVPEAQAPQVAVYQNDKFAQGCALLKDLETFRDIVAKLRRDPDFYIEERPFLLLPGRQAALRAMLAKDPASTISTLSVQPMSYEEALRDLHAHLGQRYPNFKLKGIDWEKVGQTLLPLVKDVKSDEEFGLLCLRLVARLEDSHAQLLPGRAKLPTVKMPEWDAGFACLIDDRGRPVVFHVDKDGPANKAGVTPGAAVVSVNGKPAAEAMDEYMKLASTYFGYSSGRILRYEAARVFVRQMERGATVKLELESPDGKRRSLELPATLGARYLPRLPVPIQGVSDTADVSWTRLPDDIGYIYVRRIGANLNASLDKAVGELAEVKGMVIDVRGNSGGGFERLSAVRNFDPDDPEEPQRPRYKGPIALLIDGRCISAGEGWASWFVANKRARLFGSTTAGASGRKQTYTLTNGLFSVVFPVKAYTGFLGHPIERRGLEPGVPVRCTAADLAAGKDSVLDAATQWLHTQAR
jgi:carboxyl-terminal processing protease